MVAGTPGQGGAAWAVLQYLLGFRRLGHEVIFVEPVTHQALAPRGVRLEDSANAAYFRQVMTAFGFERQSALLLEGTNTTVGVDYEELRRRAQAAGVLMNISGMLADSRLTGHIRIRVYLDLDPAFNQLWCASEGLPMRFDGHTHFVTIGQRLGEPDCPVPICGRDWLKTLPPVVLEQWPVAEAIQHDALTSVGHWRSYGSITHQGRTYGQRAHSLRPLFGLPLRTEERFVLALAIHPDEKEDLAALERNRWRLVDPQRVAGTPAAYREFIRGSKAELGVAKSGYVISRCGWFSDRSACYLASGRPVLAQETGFNQALPTGEGLLVFRDMEEAVAGIESLRANYRRHAARARAVAVEHLDSDKVLSRLLEMMGA
jgi:hypothetical protein